MQPRPSILLCLAHGNEAIEVVTFQSLLRRAGFEVISASVEGNGDLVLHSSDAIPLHAEHPLSHVVDKDYDVLLLPGGRKSCQTYLQSPLLMEALKHCKATNRYIAGMSDIPAQIFDNSELFDGANMTCIPSLAQTLSQSQWQERRVVWDPRYHLLTGQGPMCATDMSLKIIEIFKDKPCAHAITHDLGLPVGIYNFQE